MSTKKNDKGNNKRNTLIMKWVLTIILLIGGIMMVTPLIWMISTSFKTEGEVFKYPFQFITDNFSFNNYKKVWTGRNSFVIFYKNSLIITVFSVIGQVLVSSLAAYSFARIDFVGKNKVFLLYLATMMIPSQVTIIPKFLMFDAVGLLDTHIALVIQSVFSVMGVFMLRQFFLSIPFELSESALIDGASEIRIWWDVVLPLAKTPITSLVILSFVWSWNDYQTPLIFLRKKELYTIPVALDFFMDDMGTKYALMMAASTSAIIPVIIVFLLGQKQFIESIASSGIKG